MCGISKADQWQAAQALYVAGSLAANIATAFYTATFPSLVHNLPKILESEQQVRDGTKSYVVVCTSIAFPRGMLTCTTWQA